MKESIISIIFIILNYLIGSISFAILVSKNQKKFDIRKKGHKTAGGTNVIKTVGTFWGIIVGLLDILKPIPVLLAAKHLEIKGLYLSSVGLSAILGHCWPIWFGFSGGRGVATFLGSIIALSPDIALVPILIFASTLFPSLANKKFNCNFKIVSSPTLTLLAIVVYIILSFDTPPVYDQYFGLLSLIIIVLRRVTARIKEYGEVENPFELFINRFLFDNNMMRKTD